jgi:pimeloyl-ACP methyl ester carboxylesterase
MMANNIASRVELADALLRPDEPGRSPARPFRRVIAEAGNDVALVARHIRTPRPTVTPAELSRVTAEVLIVLGTRDDVGPATDLQAAIGRSTVVRPEGLGHHATLSDPRSHDAVRAFLERD